MKSRNEMSLLHLPHDLLHEALGGINVRLFGLEELDFLDVSLFEYLVYFVFLVLLKEVVYILLRFRWWFRFLQLINFISTLLLLTFKLIDDLRLWKLLWMFILIRYLLLVFLLLSSTVIPLNLRKSRKVIFLFLLQGIIFFEFYF